MNDPLLRCDGCNAVVLTKKVLSLPGCPECGHLRMRELRAISEDDREKFEDSVPATFWDDFEVRA